ncbi:hypothetical protein Tco_1145122 [Tanacetum coccineum]
MAALHYKDDHNRIAYLGRERGSEDFTDILSYLDHSPLRYALTHDPPVVFDSLVKQFLGNSYSPANKLPAGLMTSCNYRSARGYGIRQGNNTYECQPETEWVVPNPVSPGTDWRPWPSVLAPRPPTPPAQTLSLEEPLVPANYIEPEDITNLNSMEDETILGGFHEETHVGPDDAPTPTADAAGRAEDPAFYTSLSAKIDRRARTEFYTPAFAQFHAPRSTDVLPHADISESAGPPVGADKGKAPMPDLENR